LTKNEVKLLLNQNGVKNNNLFHDNKVFEFNVGKQIVEECYDPW